MLRQEKTNECYCKIFWLTEEAGAFSGIALSSGFGRSPFPTRRMHLAAAFGKRVYAGLARMNVIAADIALFVSVYDGVQIVDYNIFAGKCFQNGLVIGFDDLVPLGGKARIAFETLVFVGRRGGAKMIFAPVVCKVFKMRFI